MTLFEIAIVLICSFILGSLACIPIILIERAPALDFMMKGGFVGICVGFSNIVATMFFYKILKTHKTLISYVSLIIISAAGTFIGAYALGLRIIQYILILIFISELISIVFSISIHKYKERLNIKLQNKQKIFDARQNSGS